MFSGYLVLLIVCFFSDKVFSVVSEKDLITACKNSKPDDFYLGIGQRKNKTPLMLSITDNHKKAFEICLAETKFIDQQGHRNFTALHYAMARSEASLDFVQKLLKKNASVVVRDEDGLIPLFRAIIGDSGTSKRERKSDSAIAASKIKLLAEQDYSELDVASIVAMFKTVIRKNENSALDSNVTMEALLQSNFMVNLKDSREFLKLLSRALTTLKNAQLKRSLPLNFRRFQTVSNFVNMVTVVEDPLIVKANGTSEPVGQETITNVDKSLVLRKNIEDKSSSLSETDENVDPEKSNFVETPAGNPETPAGNPPETPAGNPPVEPSKSNSKSTYIFWIVGFFSVLIVSLIVIVFLFHGKHRKSKNFGEASITSSDDTITVL